MILLTFYAILIHKIPYFCLLFNRFFICLKYILASEVNLELKFYLINHYD